VYHQLDLGLPPDPADADLEALYEAHLALDRVARQEPMLPGEAFAHPDYQPDHLSRRMTLPQQRRAPAGAHV